MVVLSPSLSLCTPSSHHPFRQKLFFGNQSGFTMHHNKNCGLNGASQIYSSAASEPTSRRPFWRRDSLLFGLSSSLLSPFPSSEEDLKMASLVDEINAYSYLYPLEFPSKKLFFKWVESRKPERHDEADARLRNVSERVDIIDNLIISVTAPPNSRFLKSEDKSAWTAKDVADSVLSDKAALIDGEPYWYYEYLVRKSPAKTAQESNIFRHYVSSTGERDRRALISGVLVVNVQNLHCIADRTCARKRVASFRLLPPTEEYVPPYKDPWRFW